MKKHTLPIVASLVVGILIGWGVTVPDAAASQASAECVVLGLVRADDKAAEFINEQTSAGRSHISMAAGGGAAKYLVCAW